MVGPLTDALGVDHPAVELLARAIVVVATAIAIFTRVTPVLPDARGILAPAHGLAPTEREAELDAKLRTMIATARLPDDPDH